MPLFLTGPTGKLDIARARLAASATLDGYQAMSIPELLSVAQIISFSLASLGSLALSMLDDISTSMLLRLRGNANALSRSEQAHQKVLDQSRRQTAESQAKREQALQDEATRQQQRRDAEKYGFTDEAIAANVAEVQKMAADAQARLHAQPPEVAPAKSTVPVPAAKAAAVSPAAPRPPAKSVTPSVAADPAAAIRLPQRPMTPAEDHQRKVSWGAAMAAVAAEFAGDTAASPQERRLNAIRAHALSSVARQLLGDATTPPAGPHTFLPAEPPDAT